MNNMVIGIFNSGSAAESARRSLLSKDKELSLDLEDVVIMEKAPDGKIAFRHLNRHTRVGAVVGAFWGAMFGLFFLNPVFLVAGMLAGIVIGGVYGAMSHIGVDEEFITSQAESMNPGNSAICVLARRDAKNIINEVEKFEGGDLIQTRLCIQSGDRKQCSILPGRATPAVFAP